MLDEHSVHMDRRGYIVLMVVALIIASATAFIAFQTPDRQEVSFTIIHTNDSHCHYEDEGAVGFKTVSALKKELSKEGPVFVVDAGDFLQGSASGLISHGLTSVEVMNSVGYDLAVPGNHEFDYGLETFLHRASELSFPLICANLVYTDTGKNVFPGYTVIEKEGVRVGFFGLLTEETPYAVMEGCMGNTTVTDAFKAAESMVLILKKEHVDCIVCVGHMGLDYYDDLTTSDMLCASVEGIDIFIDGHSHTEMEDGKICNGSRELQPSDTIITSTGSFMNNVGVVKYSAGEISAKLYRGPALTDDVTEKAVADAMEEITEKLDSVIGTTEVLLVGERGIVRNNETNLGDLLTDIIREDSGCQIAILNAGTIRISIETGPISLQDVYDMNPYLNYVCRADVSASDLWRIMETSLSKKGMSSGGFMQFSGMTVTYDPSAESGHKVVSITIGSENIDMDSTYTLATTDYVWKGGDGYSFLMKYDAEMYDTIDIVTIRGISEIGSIDGSDIIGNRLVAV